MDPITTAIVAAIAAGAMSSLTDVSKTAITDSYNKLKDLLTKKFGAKSDVVQTIAKLEATPESAGYKQVLQEQMATAKAEQDEEVVAAAKQILIVVKSQQVSQSTITIHQDHATIQGQNIGDHQQVTQYFGDLPKIER